jgi:hypothetical protein
MRSLAASLPLRIRVGLSNMAFTDRFNRVVRIVGDRQKEIVNQALVKTPATSSTIPGGIHKSDSPPEQDPNGRQGNASGIQYPDVDKWELGADPGKRYQDIATSHMSEGPTPGRIPHHYDNRNTGKLGDELTGTPDGTTGFKMGLSGNDAGGIGGAMYIPHTSVIRLAGQASSSLRTIDDGAQVPGAFVADPTRR